MGTYGEVRMRVMQLCPGAARDMMDGWLADRYQAILDAASFRRTEQILTLQTAVQYDTGTVSVANGSSAITGTGTTWTAAMTGRMIRIAARDEWYTFTYVSGTSGTLDRLYQGDTDAAATYQINQAAYPMPLHVREIRAVYSSTFGELHQTSVGSILRGVPGQSIYGSSLEWDLWYDALDSTGIRRMWLYLGPVPNTVESYQVAVVSDEDGLTGSTSQVLLPWMRPAAIIAGVQADFLTWQASTDPQRAGALLAAAESYEARYEARKLDILKVAAAGMPARKMGIADRYARHDVARWARNQGPNDRW